MTALTGRWTRQNAPPPSGHSVSSRACLDSRNAFGKWWRRHAAWKAAACEHVAAGDRRDAFAGLDALRFDRRLVRVRPRLRVSVVRLRQQRRDLLAAPEPDELDARRRCG